MTNIAMVFRWPIEIDGLPIKNGDFPWRTVSHNQRVILTSVIPLGPNGSGKSEPRRSQQADEIRSRFQREAGGRQRHRTRMR